MSELAKNLRVGVVGETFIVWAISLVLAMMVLDGGYVLGYYFIASIFFWIGSFICFRQRRHYRRHDLLVFRLGPFILFVLGLVGETLVAIFRHG